MVTAAMISASSGRSSKQLMIGLCMRQSKAHCPVISGSFRADWNDRQSNPESDSYLVGLFSIKCFSLDCFSFLWAIYFSEIMIEFLYIVAISISLETV